MRCPPFATKCQLYTVLRDRTIADRQLDELRRRNAVRMLQLPAPAARDAYALVLTADYEAALETCRAELGASGSRADGQGTAAPAAAAEVFHWFARRVLPACTNVMVTHAELLRLLAGSGGDNDGAASRQVALTPPSPLFAALHTAPKSPGGRSPHSCARQSRAATASAGVLALRGARTRLTRLRQWLPHTHSRTRTRRPPPPLASHLRRRRPHAPRPPHSLPSTSGVGAGGSLDSTSAAPATPGEAHVSLLLARGFLTRHTAGADGYLFSLPGAGAAVRSVAAGGAELRALLARRRPPEMRASELTRRRLARSVLGVQWHLRDLVGGGLLVREVVGGTERVRLARRA